MTQPADDRPTEPVTGAATPALRSPTSGIEPHTPRRPLWICRTCAVDWPCLAARSLLAVDYVTDPAGLAVYLATQLQQAYVDLAALNPDPGPDPAALQARFLAWARPRIAVTRARLDGQAEPPE